MPIPPPSLPPLQDAHAHLQSPLLRPHLPALLERAAAAEIESIHVEATAEADWPAVLALRSAPPSPAPRLSFSLGVHPFFAASASPSTLAALRARLADDPLLGVGEIGLDISPVSPPVETQIPVYLAQLDLSFELARPVTIHGRGAWSRILPDLLSRPPHPAGILLHSYSGPADLLPRLHRLGIRISLGSALSNPLNRRVRRIVSAAAPNQLLLESDAPDQPPHPASCPPPGLDLPPPFLHPRTARPLSEPLHILLYRQRLRDLLEVRP